MKNRCYNPHVTYYYRYGGRGIGVCDTWRYDFEAFEKWSFENGYTDELTIDRINNDGNYCPDNCRWVDHATQANNRSSNVVIEYNGEKHNLAEWAEIIGIKYKTLHNRYYSGWDTKRMLTYN